MTYHEYKVFKNVSQIARGRIRHVSWWLTIILLSLILLYNKLFNGKLTIPIGGWIFNKLGKLSFPANFSKILAWEFCSQAADWILPNWLINSRMRSQHCACSIHPHQLVRISLVRIFCLCLLNCPPPKSNRTDHSHVALSKFAPPWLGEQTVRTLRILKIQVFDPS